MRVGQQRLRHMESRGGCAKYCTCRQGHHGFFFGLAKIAATAGGLSHTGRGVQECIEGFHRGFVDYLSRKFVPKWDSPICEGEFATAGTTSLLVELINMAA